MSKQILNDKMYQKITQKYISDILRYLFAKSQPFSIFCLYDYVSFNPELPSSIPIEPQPYIMFDLAGYTFESAIIKDDILEFEAGFGAENFGSVVSVPLLAIQTITIEQDTILVNLTKPKLSINKFDVPTFISETKSIKKVKKDSTNSKKSMEALLKNPENQKLLKKKKK